jgi:16S rRNA (uracil1498-N3)-methyltransferase
MRASFYPNLSIKDQYVLVGDTIHHLTHVVRLEIGEELLLSSGMGLLVKTQVESISKKQIVLKFLSSDQHLRSFDLDLALGMPKREALELSLKQAVELGIRKVYLVRSAYSQQKFLDGERVQSLLVSALEQSNSPFLPEIVEAKWEEINWKEYSFSVLMNSQNPTQKSSRFEKFTAPRLLIVGPEGGFSPEELEYFYDVPHIYSLVLPTPILRTPTAIAAGAGVMFQTLLD